jgi:hypothetical protein
VPEGDKVTDPPEGAEGRAERTTLDETSAESPPAFTAIAKALK